MAVSSITVLSLGVDSGWMTQHCHAISQMIISRKKNKNLNTSQHYCNSACVPLITVAVGLTCLFLYAVSIYSGGNRHSG